MDKARKETDKRLYQMERELKGIYRRASKDIYKSWNEYMQGAAKKIEKLQAEYDKVKESGDEKAKKSAGIKLSKEKKDVTLHDRYYKEMLSVTTQKLAQVNSIALAYVNDQMPYIYSINYNQVDTEAKKYGINFAMVDEATVKRLAKDGKIEVPEKKLKIPKDMRWNEKQINSSVLQGILQGESIPKISKRLEPIMDNNMNSAIRNARTMTTSAECHGRLDSYKTLEDDGVIQKKVWVATPDDRTRPTHIDLDGEEQDIDALFSNGCMFPGDGNGPPEEVWQCRCTIIDKIVGFKKKDGSISYVDYKDDETTHEAQMEEEKEKRGIKEEKQINTKEIRLKIIRDIERQDRSLNYEKGAVISNNGEILARYDGTTHAVEVSDNDLKLMDGATFTHNHPNGGFFSNNDIITGFIKTNLQELRASTPQGITYSLVNNGVTKESARKYLAEYQQTSMRAQRTAQEHFIRQIKAGELSMDEYKKNYFALFSQYRDEKLIKMTQEKASDFRFIFEVIKDEK